MIKESPTCSLDEKDDPYNDYVDNSMLSSDFFNVSSHSPISIDRQKAILANCSTRVKENLRYLSGLKLNPLNPQSGCFQPNNSSANTRCNIEVIKAEKSFLNNLSRNKPDLWEIIYIKSRALEQAETILGTKQTQEVLNQSCENLIQLFNCEV